jgi:hypothetical protein
LIHRLRQTKLDVRLWFRVSPVASILKLALGVAVLALAWFGLSALA